MELSYFHCLNEIISADKLRGLPEPTGRPDSIRLTMEWLEFESCQRINKRKEVPVGSASEMFQKLSSSKLLMATIFEVELVSEKNLLCVRQKMLTEF